MSHGLYLKDSNWWNFLSGGNDDVHAYQLMEALYINEPIITEMCKEVKSETMNHIAKERSLDKISKIAIALLTNRRLTQEGCQIIIGEN